jgi:hypothetical protein
MPEPPRVLQPPFAVFANEQVRREVLASHAIHGTLQLEGWGGRLRDYAHEMDHFNRYDPNYVLEFGISNDEVHPATLAFRRGLIPLEQFVAMYNPEDSWNDLFWKKYISGSKLIKLLKEALACGVCDGFTKNAREYLDLLCSFDFGRVYEAERRALDGPPESDELD